jgi:hypothetical protein
VAGAFAKVGIRRRFALLCTGILLLLAACGQKATPTEVVQEFMAAIEQFDSASAAARVCEAQKDRVESILDAFGEEAGLEEAIDLAFDKLAFEELSNDGEAAVVHVSGALVVSFLGHQERQIVNEEHVVVQEEGHWVVCDP